jgi:hypothetical protein
VCACSGAAVSSAHSGTCSAVGLVCRVPIRAQVYHQSHIDSLQGVDSCCEALGSHMLLAVGLLCQHCLKDLTPPLPKAHPLVPRGPCWLWRIHAR